MVNFRLLFGLTSFRCPLWSSHFSCSGPAVTDFYNIANGYDLVSIIKQAIEANGGTTDGSVLAKWIIEHPADIKLLTIKQHKATNQNHFMFGPSDFVLVETPTKRNESYMYKRAGC